MLCILPTARSIPRSGSATLSNCLSELGKEVEAASPKKLAQQKHGENDAPKLTTTLIVGRYLVPLREQLPSFVGNIRGLFN